MTTTTTVNTTLLLEGPAPNLPIVLLDIIIVILALTGNSMVVYTILKERKLQTKCNYLLLNLAVCDIIVVTLGTSIDIMLQFTESKWVLGSILCRMLNPTMTMFYISASLIMVVISLDRYQMFVHPLKARYQRKHVKYSVIVVHFISLACVIPFSVFSTISDDGYCFDVWPSLWYRKGYTVFLVLVQYALPLLIMGVAYTGVALSLLRNKAAFKKTHEARAGSNKSKSTSIRSTMSRTTSSLSGFCPHTAAKECPHTATVCQDATDLEEIEDGSRKGKGKNFARSITETSLIAKERRNCAECAVKALTEETLLENGTSSERKKRSKWSKSSFRERIFGKCKKKGLQNGGSGKRLITNNNNEPLPMSRRQRFATKETEVRDENTAENHHHTADGSLQLSRQGGMRRRSGPVPPPTAAHMKRDQRNNHALKMILLVVVVFAIFMLPMQIMSLILDFGGKPTPVRYSIYAWFVMCSYFGSCTLNPFIYGLVDRTFRASFKKIGRKIAHLCECK